MKRSNFLLFIFLIAFPLASAGSVGISPAHFNEHFEPGLEKTFTFNTFNSNPEEGIGIMLEGDLTQYANVSTNYIQGSGQFEVSIKLPGKLEKPGTHTLLVKVFESKNLSKEKMSGVGGIAAINAPIKILVPYPGKYTESTFKVNNANKGEDTSYELEIQNLGTEKVTIQTSINIFKNNISGEKILTKKLDEITLESKNILNIINDLNTSQLKPGNYYATATIDYGKKDILNDTFRIGEFLIEIVDYNYQFERGRINQFDIEIENKWNAQINHIFATVTITDQGKVVSDFRTVSTETQAWEKRNITGFFDATNLEPKRYLANINLFYENLSSNKLVAIYIQDPPESKNYIIYIIIGTSIGAIAIITGFIFLIIKIIKLKKFIKKNGKKK